LFIISSSANSEELSAFKALLHYKGNKSVIGVGSSFFLSPEGHRNPLAELEATIYALKNNPETQCRYPARLELLLEINALFPEELPKAHCEDYEIYLQKVPFERIYLVFAAEDQSPASIMGHTLLKIAGSDADGILREHSFSFMAIMQKSGNITRYINAILKGSEGIYSLSPYQKITETYILNENRSLWEFEVDISDADRKRLQKHLWELKETDILYQFITHNCNTAAEAILNAVDQAFEDQNSLLFSTPIEYLQYLSEKGKIRGVTLLPTKNEREIISLFGAYYPLNAPGSSKISLDGFHRGAKLTVSPIYRDIRSIVNASPTEYDSKIAEITLELKDNRFFLERFDLLATQSIGDFRIIGLSKAFRLALEESTKDLSGVLELGRGVGFSPLKGVTLYSMAKFGGSYGKTGNLFASVDSGVIARLGYWGKIIANYEYYWDTDSDYRAYRSRLRTYAGFALFKEWDMHIGIDNEFDKYTKTTVYGGVSVHF
jgi:hypothetical protein